MEMEVINMKKLLSKREMKILIDFPNYNFNSENFFKHFFIDEYVFKGINYPTLNIKIVDSNPNIIWEEENETMTVYVNKFDDSALNVISILANSLMVREFEKNDIYMLHGSCVSINNKIYILFGSSGSGKTVCALNLCKNNKFKYISNGATLIENKKELQVIGTYKKGIKLRGSSIIQFDKKMFEIYFKNTKLALNDEKVEVMPKDLNLDICDLNKLNGQNLNLYFIKLNKTDFICTSDVDYRNKMILLEDLSRHLKMSDVYCELNDYPIFMPSIDNEELYIKRIKFINKLMNFTYKGNLYGNLVDMTNYIQHSTNLDNGEK